MPYITKEDRAALDVQGLLMDTPGHLNYKITKLLLAYLTVKGTTYSTINDIVGALEGAKQEFYRRVAIPYENSKIALNGDVYSSEGK